MLKVTAREALTRLQEGNQRFVAELRSISKLPTASHRVHLAQGQNPFAAILSCSDSRVPSEMVFDQGLGDLFVVRVAGNVVAPSLVGSLEYAVEVLGVELVVVMGHTACGAVIATLDAIEGGAAGAPKNVLDIVERIRPGVEHLHTTEHDRQRRIDLATQENVRASVRALHETSPLLARKAAAGQLIITGAEYSLTSGEVAFFDGRSATKPEGALEKARKPSVAPATA